MFCDTITQVLSAKKSSDIEQLIDRLNNMIKWIPIGGHTGNYGIIAMGSDPYDGLTERITNSMDAMIELKVEQKPSLKNSKNPREAIEKIHRFRDGNLKFADRKKLSELASDIKLKFFDSEDNNSPTIEIRDRGIGQHPSDFSKTLLSLNSDYKVSKLYLIGAFGQGGQTSFANCRYGLIISRKHPNLLTNKQKDVIGWTIVRYRDPSTTDVIYKRGLWEYCVNADTGNILEETPDNFPEEFDNGTLIRLIAYNMPRGTSDVLQPSGTAWGYLSQSLFDPVLPIRLYEERNRYSTKNRPLSGLAPRLWSGGKGEKVKISDNSYEVDIGSNGFIKINYWMLQPSYESGLKSHWKDIKKGFVSKTNAIFVTLNGQRHGIESYNFLRDEAGLAYSYDYILIQVDCDNLSNYAKKGLLSSTRERLKEGKIKDLIMDELARHLRNDRNILAFEKKRKEEILSAKTQRDTTKIRNMVGKFISQNPYLSELISMKGTEKIKKPVQKRINDEKEEDTIEDLIDDLELEVPELKEIPTYLIITNSSDPIRIEKGGNALIRIETDANDNYLEGEKFDRFRCIHKSMITKRKSCSELRNGKISYHIHMPFSTRVGTKETLRFELDLPNGESLSAERSVICTKPIDRKTTPKNRSIPEPKIDFINKEDELWNKLGYTTKCVGEVFIDETGSDSKIIVSMENIHLQNALRKHRLKTSIIERTKDRYGAAIAYYLLLKYVDDKKGKNNNDNNGDPRASPELLRVAETISYLSLPLESL